MDYIYIGEAVNTHGIKGEIRILSAFKFKDKVFIPSFKLYISNDELIINSYRKHKNYDMVTFKNISTIEDVLKYKGEPVYIRKKDLVYDGYLDEDLIGLDVYNDKKYMGCVKEILKNSVQDILVIENEKTHMVPYVDEFIKSVDIKNKRIEIKYIKGLTDED